MLKVGMLIFTALFLFIGCTKDCAPGDTSAECQDATNPDATDSTNPVQPPGVTYPQYGIYVKPVRIDYDDKLKITYEFDEDSFNSALRDTTISTLNGFISIYLTGLVKNSEQSSGRKIYWGTVVSIKNTNNEIDFSDLSSFLQSLKGIINNKTSTVVFPLGGNYSLKAETDVNGKTITIDGLPHYHTNGVDNFLGSFAMRLSQSQDGTKNNFYTNHVVTDQDSTLVAGEGVSGEDSILYPWGLEQFSLSELDNLLAGSTQIEITSGTQNWLKVASKFNGSSTIENTTEYKNFSYFYPLYSGQKTACDLDSSQTTNCHHSEV